ncbi:D-alanine--D-alanine ligase [Nibrella viscosa]|uniref:D-alanine--D-alanine ligase n=2 Tax=Nibrella viscosa TaxID=1084524 RepID=A0ABP8KTZ2_9BACT
MTTEQKGLPLPDLNAGVPTSKGLSWFSSPFFIRLRHWEYWPFWVVYFPIVFYWLWLSLKARSLFFFTASNPAIETGGMLGESKIDILNKIDDAYKPLTGFIQQSASLQDIQDTMLLAGITFPIIIKPNVGERGRGVEKITSPHDLQAYWQRNQADCLVQEYVDSPLELGVFYYRYPGQATGVISSIVRKEFLSVTGDGRSTLLDLILQNERARLQLPRLQAQYRADLHQLIPAGQKRELVPIGNHSRGTKFLNGNHLINEQLTAVFARISQSIDGFYYGRYDLRCRSLADLYAGRGIRILELNGAGAEPAHIYQPGFSLLEAYRVLFHHWRVLYEISRENHRLGTPYPGLKEAIRLYRKAQTHKKSEPAYASTLA